MSAESEVQRAVQSYIDACNARDVKAYKETLAEDVVFMVPDQPPIQGREAVGAWVKEGFFDPYEITFDAKTDRVVVVGSEAFAPGRFTLKMKPNGGGDPVETSGEFFDIFRRVSEGSWKYSYVIFNFDQPFG